MSDAALRPDVLMVGMRSSSHLVAKAVQLAPGKMDSPVKTSSCMTDVWFTAFFDGSNNSMYDENKRPAQQQEYTNIARLFFSHVQSDASKAIAAQYLQGVGRRFPEIGDPGGAAGMGTGFMGIERVDFAEKRLAFAINTQKSRGPKVDTVHVAVFGFSRGATLARAFVNRLAKQAKQQGGQWFREGARLRIYFVGIFDTVASVGLPREHNTYARELGIPPIVERCVHMIAAHELRFAFPLDSVRRDGHYPANTVEYVYPGMHSDVGGGYAAEEQGRFNAYEKLPLHRMYHEAAMAGVPLLPPERWDAHIRSLFVLPDGLPAAFTAYMSALETTGQSVEEEIFGHLKLYWRWRKMRMNNAKAPIPERLSALSQQAKQENQSLFRRLMTLRSNDRLIGVEASSGVMSDSDAARLKSDADEQEVLNQEIATNNEFDTDIKQQRAGDEALAGEARALSRTVASGRASDWEKAVWEAWNDPRPLPGNVAAFFDDFIHDSQIAWNHATDAVDVAIMEMGASQTCGMAFNAAAEKYCSEVRAESQAGTVEYLRPRTLFFGPKEAVFASSDTGF